MKKWLVILISLILIMLLSMSVYAVETSHEGEIELSWTNNDLFGSSYTSSLAYDFKKDFGQGLSAGLGLKISPDENWGQLVYDWGAWATMDFEEVFVCVDSWKDDYSSANYMGGGYSLPEGPGITVDFKYIPNVVINTHLGSFSDWVPNPEDPLGDWIEKPFYNYGVKTTYDGGRFKVGAGYQGYKVDKPMYGYAIWGEAKIIDMLTISGEFGYRTDNLSWWEEEWGWTSDPVEGKGFQIKLDYKDQERSASLLCLQKDPFFLVNKWEDDDVGVARNEFMMKEWTGTLLGLNADFNVTKYLNTKLHLDYIINVEDPRDERNWAKDYNIGPLYARVDARYRATLATTLLGWFDSWGEKQQEIGLGVEYYSWGVSGSYDLKQEMMKAEASYTFTDDYLCKLEVEKSKDSDITYLAKLEITL